ncbi:MAG TPA: alcohol dehydrogenase catalytic domain-containing protein [Candidatus Baltobacteraceae bacterium]|jgi:propanol-preferring alcohol dehydrogenase|nr:alcohol dehydrogenase catalytic domain-containing protein [Candidatus Baltobacteraceae bacterium]
MRAAILEQTAPIESGPLAMRDVPTPVPGRGEILMKVTACGVCRSNLHMIEGDWLDDGVPAKIPIVPGHEVVGRVEQLGDGVEDFSVGDRIGVQPLWSSCLRCEYCLTGRENLCGQRLITGEHLDGGYAQFMISKAAHTYRVPDGLIDAEAAPLFCPGITAYHAVEKANLRPGQLAAIFGMGGVGHMIVQLAALSGAEVIVVARGEKHRALAKRLGAVETIDASTRNAGKVLKARGGVDAAFVFAPSSEMLVQAIDAVKPGGAVVNGAAKGEIQVPFDDEKLVVGSVIGPRAQMQTVLELAAAGKIRVVAQTFPLERAADALMSLKRGEIEARAVLTVE